MSVMGSLLLIGCAPRTAIVPPVAAVPMSGADQVVALRSGLRSGMLVARFRDGTIAALDTWSNGVITTRWRTTVQVRDFAVDGVRVCLITTVGDIGCLPRDPRPFVAVLHEPDATQIAVSLDGDVCVVTTDGRTRCIRSDGVPQERTEQLFEGFGLLRSIIPKTHCAIDVMDRLICNAQLQGGVEAPRIVLEEVEDASLVTNGPYLTSGCALMKDRTVRCWGSNRYGQLGQGDREHLADPTVVPGLEDVVRLAHSHGRTCAIQSYGTAWCFGQNFGPDFVSASGQFPRCRMRTVRRVYASRSGDLEVVREKEIVRDRAERCFGPGERYAPWPTRITLFERAQDMAMNRGGVGFLRDDGTIVSVGYSETWSEATPSPWPNDPREGE